MTTYQISFFKTLLSSNGHPFRCLQGQVEVNAHTPEQAAQRAEQRFERLHRLAKWNLWADSVDICEVHRCTGPGKKPPVRIHL